ncbi:Rho GDP-dissociation inhibitor 1 [Capsicum chinense]|nr:Rho GDP-dissociation inhibitor 1 [Capsicum chinense]
MGFDDNNNKEEEEVKKGGVGDSDSEMEHENKVSRQMSESSMYTTEDEDEDENVNKLELGPQCSLKEQFEKDKDEDENVKEIELGPQCTLKEQFEKDKDDESLRRWKEQLLGSVDINAVGESLDPEVKMLSLEIKSPGRANLVLPIPEDGKPKSPWFVLKEGSKYSLKFTFQVNNNIVTGLKYTNTVWKTGIKVDSMKEMIGAFSPQTEPYTHEMPEETTPSGIFARGSYSARTKGHGLVLRTINALMAYDRLTIMLQFIAHGPHLYLIVAVEGTI